MLAKMPKRLSILGLHSWWEGGGWTSGDRKHNSHYSIQFSLAEI